MFLHICYGLKIYTAFKMFDEFYSDRQKDCVCLCVCVHAPRVGIVYLPGLFLNWCTKIGFSLKDESISRLHQLLWWRWKLQCCGFYPKLNMKCGLVCLCRCWGSFRSGAACQPWSRNCCDAAASSSTVPFLRCSSRPPPSAHTSAPRGQRTAGNKFAFQNTDITKIVLAIYSKFL